MRSEDGKSARLVRYRRTGHSSRSQGDDGIRAIHVPYKSDGTAISFLGGQGRSCYDHSSTRAAREAGRWRARGQLANARRAAGCPALRE